jgi:hypothetical protein
MSDGRNKQHEREMMKTKQQRIEAKAQEILNVLSKQKFADWYNNGNFDNYITGEMKHDAENEKIVIIDIIKMFDLQ